jgi:hypothetical protein
MSGERLSFIFFISLEESLPVAYYRLRQALLIEGFTLVPVKLDQIQSLISITDQKEIMVICSVTSFREVKNYNQKVRPYLKYILSSKKISYFCLSSFLQCDDYKRYSQTKNYFFVKYPFTLSQFSQMLSVHFKSRLKQASSWPGGKRSRLSGVI